MNEDWSTKKLFEGWGKHHLCPQKATSEGGSPAPALSEPQSAGEPYPGSQRHQVDEGGKWHDTKATMVIKQHAYQGLETESRVHAKDAERKTEEIKWC